MMVNLRQICLTGGDYPVALGAGQVYSAHQLRQQALGLAAVLSTHAEQRWALWLTSPREFLAAFLALALAGKHIILPGNMQQGSAQQLASEFDGLISREDFPGLECARLHPNQGASNANFTPDLTRDIAITLFTSGSTGEPKAIAKHLSLLEAELDIQQQQWGTQLGQVPVVATVSHQHIYGLLHAVLWPFLRGAPFVDEACQYPEELIAKVEELGEVVLISSPTHLARLPQAPVVRVTKARFAAVFSSGGLLGAESALAVAEMAGQAPVEILGSTETGGVAWRQQGRHNNLRWQSLPGVEISRDAASGCLTVWATHLGMREAFVMGDKVAFHSDGGFTLLGRADKLVKVEGKRLSLTEMEGHLRDSDLVSQARLAVIKAKREAVGAVVVLTPAGCEYLARHGKLALNQELRKYLLAYFERPLLPRRWRYVEELPCDAQGKVTASALESILGHT